MQIHSHTIPDAIATAIRANHVSLNRLADQLNANLYELAANIFRAGVEAIDDELGEYGECYFPLRFTRSEDERTGITQALDDATPERLDEFERAGNGCPQVALWGNLSFALPPQLEEEAAKIATRKGESLSQYVSRAIQTAIMNGQ